MIPAASIPRHSFFKSAISSRSRPASSNCRSRAADIIWSVSAAIKSANDAATAIGEGIGGSEAAFAEPMQIHSSMLKRYDLVAPHFAVYVRKQLEDRYGSEVLYQGGLKVYTTIDLEIQRIAEEEARAQVAKLKEQGEDVNNAAAVVMRARTGEILAMVGSLDYWNEEIDGNVNVAVAPRQPGSSFKPFSYVTAFHQGHTAADMVMDVHSCFDDYPNPPYCPENYDREYLGPRHLTHL